MMRAMAIKIKSMMLTGGQELKGGSWPKGEQIRMLRKARRKVRPDFLSKYHPKQNPS